jgi:protein-S-isoprenylcysteine O-methyltransferase
LVKADVEKMMTLTDGFRLWFIMLYGLGVLSFVVMFVRLNAQRQAIEKQEGPLPSPGILIPLGIPLFILITRLGELSREWFMLRWIGVLLSLYFLLMLPWMLRALGRFALPGAGILRDHKLITSGPYRFVRHPLYSAAIMLWLGAGLGTLNWLLLALWPLFVTIIIILPVQHEEELLRQKFGEDYEQYQQETGRLVPRLDGQ